VVHGVDEERHGVQRQVGVLGPELPRHVLGRLQGGALETGGEEVEVGQGRHEPAPADQGVGELHAELLQRLQALLRQVDVLDRQQLLAQAGDGPVRDARPARVGHRLHHVGAGPRRQQHQLRALVALQDVDEERDDALDGEHEEGVLGRHGEQVAELGEALQLGPEVRLLLQVGQDPLDQQARLRRPRQQELAAQPALKQVLVQAAGGGQIEEREEGGERGRT